MSLLACPRAIGILVAALLFAVCRPAPAASPLYDAVTRNDVATVRAEILRGADVNARQDYGRTPLHIAARSGHSEVAALLLAGGAEIDAANPSGLTPLHMSAIWGQADVAELLLANCAEVDAENVDRSTPLHLTVASGHSEVAELLLANGAEVNAQRRGRVTPLRVALNYRRWELAALLRDRAGLVDAARVGATDGGLPEVAAISPEIASDPADERRPGRRGRVEHVQELLTELGYDPGPVDGRMGGRTIESIRSFQSEIRQVVTGAIGACLVFRLEATVRERRSR